MQKHRGQNNFVLNLPSGRVIVAPSQIGPEFSLDPSRAADVIKGLDISHVEIWVCQSDLSVLLDPPLKITFVTQHVVVVTRVICADQLTTGVNFPLWCSRVIRCSHVKNPGLSQNCTCLIAYDMAIS